MLNNLIVCESMRNKIPKKMRKKNLSMRMLYLAIFLFFSVNLFAQVTVNIRNSSIKSILKEIEKNTKYKFFYNEDLKILNKVTSLNVNSESIDIVMDKLLDDSETTYKKRDDNIIMLLPKTNMTQPKQTGNKKVVGIITDKSGEPIIGANILVKGTSIGTITDINGKFSLEVPKNAEIVVSYIGYQEQKIDVRDKSTIKVGLQEDTKILDEVVVVGYGIVKKSDLTGAVSSITSDQIKERSNANVMSSLSGQIAGVQIQQTQGAPGYAPAIKVRGISTITAGATPLYVIDGFPLENADLSVVNPQDIASIEVLKDASSAAIYGSRGANGVVLITTKGGKEGKTKVEANYEFGMQKLTRKVDMMDSQEFIQYYVDAHNNSWIANGGKASDPNSARPSSYQIPQEFLDEPGKFATTDWQDVLFRTGQSQNAQLSVSGGSDKTQFRLSGSYLNQQGIVDRSFYERMSIRSNVTHKILPNLKVGVNLAFSRIHSRIYGTGGKSDAVSLSLQNDPIFPVYNENGNYGFKDPESEWYRFVPYSLQLWHPYAITREINKSDITMNTIVSMFMEYNFLKHFTFKTSLNATNNDRRYQDFRNQGQKYGWSAVQVAEANDDTYRTYNWLFENTLNYDQTFGKHSLNVLLGYSAQKNNYEETTLTAQSFPNNMVHTLNAGTPTAGASNASNWSMISYIGRANYSYDNKYLMTATLRRDGCSRFGENNRWGYFPSASVAWKVSEEEFIKNLSWISNMKIRASYGVTGNDQIDNYGSIGLLSQNQYAYGTTLTPGLYTSTISNPDLKWEKTGQFDLGLNVGLFGNRIYFEADYYYSKTQDLLLNVPVPAITGYTQQLTNIGRVRNAGLEFLLNTKNLVGDFKWETSFNISMNRNKVLKLGPNNSPIYINNWGTTKTEIGQPVANYYGYIFDGVFKNQEEVDNYPHVSSTTPGDPIVRDVNNDGVIDDNDRTVIGNAQPDFTYGLTNTFTYKNFDLTVVLQGSEGNEIMNSSTRFLKYYNGNRNGYKEIVNYWKSESNPGDGIHFKPYLNYPGLQTQFSSYWVEDGSFLRISNVRLGYNFPEKLLKKTPFSTARLYVNVDNLHVFSKFVGYDPENSVFTDALNTGNDYGAYPIPMTITFGVKVGI